MFQVLYGSNLSGGTVRMPSSKSAAHRAVLCAALSRGCCTLSHVDMNQDIEATVAGVEALGAKTIYDRDKKLLALDASALCAGEGKIDCGESGSTLRFLIPIAAVLGGRWTFTGRGRLPQRPLGIYENLLPRHGVSFCSQGGLPLTIEGKLSPGEYSLPGNVSSQFVTGLLFSLPLLQGDSEIRLTSPLESEGYVDLTCSMLKNFGIETQKVETGWKVPGEQKYKVQNYSVEGDWSQAAFFLCMAAVSPTGAKICLEGLDPRSVQGDKACVELFQRFGLQTAWEGKSLIAWNPRVSEPFGGLHGFPIDAAQIPDMVPALAVCGALSGGETRIFHAERLRLKESDRLAAMAEALNKSGGRVEILPDGLLIQGTEHLSGGTVEGKNDHRVVMAMAAAALRCEKELKVTDAWSIRKSYPQFFADFKRLGGKADVVDMG